MYSLIIETSTDRGLIACTRNEEIVFAKEFMCGQNQSKLLMPYLMDSLKVNQLNISDLSCIGIGVGPGSYTGIRVGVSVAQALAVGYQIPLVEISSLAGFVPAENKRNFAAIIDARIAGAYVQKASEVKETVQELSYPQICSLEQLPDWLGEIEYLVTPNSQNLKAKLARLYPDKEWQWEERFPCVHVLSKFTQLAYQQKQVKQAGNLTLLYLKETLAERQKETKAQ